MTLFDQLLTAVKRYIDWHGACHENECPGDDTCDCKGKPINEEINNVIRLADYRKEREARESVAHLLCFCCHHPRGKCPHCSPRLSGLDKLLDYSRGNAMPSSVCQCNGPRKDRGFAEPEKEQNSRTNTWSVKEGKQ